MTTPAQYELYRVILDYEALQDGFLDRIDDLNTTMGSIPDFADGAVQKLLTKNPGKAIARLRDHRSASAKRTFGWESLGKMLEGTGLALVLVVDDARFAPIKEQLAKRRRINKPYAKPVSKQVLRDFKSEIFRNNGRLGGKRRLVKLSKRQRTLIAKAGAAARWPKNRTRKCAASPVVSS